MSIVYILIMCCISFNSLQARQALIVIDPAGNVRNPGRKLSDSFERGSTLQCAEMLKKKCEQSGLMEIHLTRTAGSHTTQEQNAQMSNRLNADLYIHLSFFHETEVKPRLFIYTFSYDNDFPLKLDTLSFCPYDQAHCVSIEKTNTYAQKLHKTMLASPYAAHPTISLPYLPLKGITAPAIGIEIGLHTTRDWRECVPFLVQNIMDLVTDMRT